MSEEQQFKLIFIASFLANKTALDYDKFCDNGGQDLLAQFHLMEDAIFLADEAWNRLVKQREVN